MENNNPDAFYFTQNLKGDITLRREWTKSEELYMTKRYLLQSVKDTSCKLDRSEDSIKRKASRMGLNHYNNAISAKTLARCFGSDVAVVIRWINKFELPCKKVKYSNQTRYMIQAEEFWKWADNHRDIVPFQKYENKSLCPEPGWLSETKLHNSKSGQRYTENDIILIKNMLHRGFTYKQIANEMRRSYWAISHFCRKIYTL